MDKVLHAVCSAPCRGWLTALVVWLLTGCAPVEHRAPPDVQPEPDPAQVITGWFALRDLGEIDAVVRVNNAVVARHAHAVLTNSALPDDSLRIDGVELVFGRQHIALRAEATLRGDHRPATPAILHGDLRLAVSGSGLFWLPQIERVEITEPADRNGTGEVDTAEWVERSNRWLADRVVLRRLNVIGLASVPLGSIELEAALDGLPGASARRQFPLRGTFAVAGSAQLIETAYTTMALDLQFIPGVVDCATDVRVSRSGFVDRVVDREPRGVIREATPGLGDLTFYTEISGAVRPTTVVHYWLADGRTVNVSELPVEPSERWRTWSSIVSHDTGARNWQVIVAEKQSGCLLATGAITAGHDGAAQQIMDPNPFPTGETFGTYRREFESQITDFPAATVKPGVAIVELPSLFFRDALNASLMDRQFAVTIPVPPASALTISGSLEVAAEDIECPVRDCSGRRDCAADFTRCQRRTDERDCRNCQFRNPLNNRCISESVDEVCEQIKANRNRDHALAWEACMAGQEAAQRHCEQASASQLAQCEREAAEQDSACQASLRHARQQTGGKFRADAVSEVSLAGQIGVLFANLRITGGFTKVSADLMLEPDVELGGMIKISSAGPPGPLGACLQAWDGPLELRLTHALSGVRRVGRIEAREGSLGATWPAATFFAESAEALASQDGDAETTAQCPLGPLGGRSGPNLTGVFPIEVKARMSRLSISPLSVDVGGEVLRAEPERSGRHVRYELHSGEAAPQTQ